MTPAERSDSERVVRVGKTGPGPLLGEFIRASDGIADVIASYPAVTYFRMGDGDTLALWWGDENEREHHWQAGVRP